MFYRFSLENDSKETSPVFFIELLKQNVIPSETNLFRTSIHSYRPENPGFHHKIPLPFLRHQMPFIFIMVQSIKRSVLFSIFSIGSLF